ncbi:glycosyltransferase [Dokdonella sp.]|uniref:glycosyltransferase n=1 Tax=Dokdonella sp. TaxID=2291710 RepID=UPI0031C78262|nr:glycosyltransferase [Dokdonella sp.]
MSRVLIGAYVLAKDEASNIGRCLAALEQTGWRIHVLDSGSTDNTRAIVETFDGIRCESYGYVDHCTAYNDVISCAGGQFDAVVVLDADMIVSPTLRDEVEGYVGSISMQWDVLCAPIEMWVDGHALKAGSLCPPKAFVFRPGRALFVGTGHAEAPVAGARIVKLIHPLVHDDRKPYASFLASQVRYAQKLVQRYQLGAVRPRDRLRVTTPLFVLLTPLFSLLLKLGFRSGRLGILYAMDRMIAEAVMYRTGLAARIDGVEKDGVDLHK